MSFGALGGPLFSELRNEFYDCDERPLISNFICGLGGRDVTPEMLEAAFNSIIENRNAGRVRKPVNYLGLRE